MGFANFNYWTHCSLFCVSVIQLTLCFLSISFCERLIDPTTSPGSRPPSTLMARVVSCLLYTSRRGILKFYFLCIFKIFRVNSSMFSCLGIEFMVCNFLYF